MRKLFGLIATFTICAMLIVPANAKVDNPGPIELTLADAVVLINEEMDNWTDRDLGTWLIEHSYEFPGGHDFVTMFYGPVFHFKVAKAPTYQNENGFDCSQVIGSVFLPSDRENQTNGIAVTICVKGEAVTVDIKSALKRSDL